MPGLITRLPGSAQPLALVASLPHKRAHEGEGWQDLGTDGVIRRYKLGAQESPVYRVQIPSPHGGGREGTADVPWYHPGTRLLSSTSPVKVETD